MKKSGRKKFGEDCLCCGEVTDGSGEMVDRLLTYFLSIKQYAGQAQVKFTDMRLLYLIESAEPGSATISGLSALLRVKSPTMTQLIDRLQREGYVLRRASEQDRRSVIAELTPQGRQALRGMFSQVRGEVGELVEHLGEADTRELNRLLSRVFAYLDIRYLKREDATGRTTKEGEDA